MSTDLPIISVLMPAYNVDRYIEEAVRSVLGQTLTNIEVVVVDDCSTDGTAAILRRIAATDPRVVLVSLDRNLGISAALNAGLAACRASYIARADGDDVSLPGRLERQLAFMMQHPDTALSGCALEKINDRGEYIAPGPPILTTTTAITNGLRWFSPCFHPTWIVRRELYEKLGGYRLPGLAEDVDFLLLAVTNGATLGNISDVLVRWRMRSGNTPDRAGLMVYKTRRYAMKLYRERLKRGTDSFSTASFVKETSVSPVQRNLYRLSQWLAKQAYRKPGTLRRYCFYALAAIASPYCANSYWWALRARLVQNLEEAGDRA